MEGCHPMFDDACGCTCEEIVLPNDLQLLSIRLFADEGCRQRKSHVELLLDIFPKGADKYSIYV